MKYARDELNSTIKMMRDDINNVTNNIETSIKTLEIKVNVN